MHETTCYDDDDQRDEDLKATNDKHPERRLEDMPMGAILGGYMLRRHLVRYELYVRVYRVKGRR